MGYYSDQSDSWSIIKISGEDFSALERICPIDLSIEKFKIDGVNRTQMEHLSVIMIRIAVNEFILMSQIILSFILSYSYTVSTKYIVMQKPTIFVTRRWPKETVEEMKKFFEVTINQTIDH